MSLTTRNYGTPTAPRGSAQTPAHWAWCRPTTESGCEHWTWCPTVLSQRRKGSPHAHPAALVSVEPEFRPIAESLSGLRVGPRPTKTPTAQLEVSPLRQPPGHLPSPGVARWLVLSGIDTGPAFRSRSSRQPRNEAPERPGRRSHGQAPRARSRSRRRGNTRLAIMRHGRWRSAAVILGYVGGLDLNDNAAARLGL